MSASSSMKWAARSVLTMRKISALFFVDLKKPFRNPHTKGNYKTSTDFIWPLRAIKSWKSISPDIFFSLKTRSSSPVNSLNFIVATDPVTPIYSNVRLCSALSEQIPVESTSSVVLQFSVKNGSKGFRSFRWKSKFCYLMAPTTVKCHFNAMQNNDYGGLF